jgi:hypothetical protein
MDDTSEVARGYSPLWQVATMFAELGLQLRASDARSAFDAVASVASRRISGASAASITVLREGRFHTVAASDERARQADLIQYEMGSGPCVDAILDSALYHPVDLRDDSRWPQYGARVSKELGWYSMLSYRLGSEVTGHDVLAGLNIYSDRPRAFDQSAVEIGLLLATHAAAVVAAQTNRLRAENLQEALNTNRGIGVAIGVLMTRHKLTQPQAFDLLRIASQNTNRKIRDIAEEVALTGQLPTPPARSADPAPAGITSPRAASA